MQDNTNLIESLIEKVTGYSKTSYELVLLKVVDKSSDRISSFVPSTVGLFLFVTIMLFINLGMAFWLGKIMGELFYGFFLVASFYVFVTIIFYLFMRNWVKRIFYDYIIRQLLNNK